MVALETAATTALPHSLDTDRRIVGKSDQQVEVLVIEAVSLERRVDLHEATDAVLFPERRTHRRSDAVNADRLTADEAIVAQGVEGQEGDLLTHHGVENRARDRHVVFGTELDLLSDAGELAYGVVGIADQDEAAIDRQCSEGHLHDAVEHVVHGVGLQQVASQQRQMRDEVATLLVAGDRDLADHRQPEIGLEIGEGANDRCVAERRDLIVWTELDGQLEDTDLDLIADRYGMVVDRNAVDLDAIGRALIGQEPLVSFAPKECMATRDRVVRQDDVVVDTTADSDLIAFEPNDSLTILNDEA